MNTIQKPKFEWAVFAVAILAWIGVAYFAWLITEMQNEHASSIAGMTAKTEKRAAAERLHASLQNTKQERSALGALAQTDIVSIVGVIDRVGTMAGIKIQIDSTLPESTTSKTTHALVFSMHANGTFSQIARAAKLFETLPIPSTVEQFNISRDANSWNLNTQVRVLTTATI